MKREQALRQVEELLDSQGLGVLATESKGRPHTSLVAYARTEDLRRLMFGTTKASRKYSNIQINPRVAMLVDNRSNEVSDFKDAMAITAMGNAFEPEGEEREMMLEAYKERHSYLSDFASSPTIAFIAIEVESYNLVSRFQKVLELRMDD